MICIYLEFRFFFFFVFMYVERGNSGDKNIWFILFEKYVVF